MKILLIGGKAGAGKDTVANFIVNNFPNVKKMAVADSLKNLAITMGWDGEKDERGRRFLQHLGQVGREYDSSMWIKDIVWRINARLMSTRDNLIVISDFRFPNEFEVLSRLYHNSVITVVVVGREIEMPADTKDDISENSLEDFKFDYTIDNSKDLFTLEKVVKKFVEDKLCIYSK